MINGVETKEDINYYKKEFDKKNQIDFKNKLSSLNNKIDDKRNSFATKSDIEEKINLEDIKNICPNDFLEKFELLELIKSGSAGYMVKGCLKNEKYNTNKALGFKFLIDPRAKRETLKKGNTNKHSNKHSEISMHILLKNIHFPEILGYYKINEDSCILMEYVKYGDLENFKKKNIKEKLSCRDICFIYSWWFN